MKKIKTKIKDLVIYRSKIHKDNRGNVREIYKKNNIGKPLIFFSSFKFKKKCN